MNNPSFIGIGIGRAGSTNLYVALIKGHKELQGASTKEIGFFGGEKYKKGLKWYKKQFPSNCYSGEFTPWYFYRKESLKAIKKHYPKTPLILLIRNPIDRIYSFFMLLWAVDRIKENTLEKVLKTDEGKKMLREGRYSDYLPSWQKHFSDNLIILKSEDYWNNPQKHILDIYGKLDLEKKLVDGFNYRKLHRGSYKEWHPKGDIFHKVDHAKRIRNRKSTDFPPVKMKYETKKILLDFYKESNEKLRTMTGISWKEWS